MNKKIILIIVVLLAIIAIAGACIFVFNTNPNQNENSNEITETGAFNGTTILINGYKVNIDSKEVGHPSGESYFKTSFDMIDNNQYKSTYNVDFLVSNSTSNNSSEEVTINGKKFNYQLDESKWNAILFYPIPGGNNQLVIKVTGSSVFDSNGNQAKHLATIDKEVLESNELAGIINFTVTK